MVSIKLPKSIIYWGVAVCFAVMTLYAFAISCGTGGPAPAD